MKKIRKEIGSTEKGKTKDVRRRLKEKRNKRQKSVH